MPACPWSCDACNQLNASHAAVCIRCGCPSESGIDIRLRYRKHYLAGKVTYIGNNEPTLSIADRCPQCGSSYNQFTPRCQSCGQHFWCRWNPAWYEHPLSRISLGQSPTARRTGLIFAVSAVLFFIYTLAVFYVSHVSSIEWEGLLILGAVVVYSAYEVWAFTHGRRTTMEHWTHEGTPDNTQTRVLGLVMDLLLCAGAICLIIL